MQNITRTFERKNKTKTKNKKTNTKENTKNKTKTTDEHKEKVLIKFDKQGVILKSR